MAWPAMCRSAEAVGWLSHRAAIDRHFALPRSTALLDSLAADADPWAQSTRAELLKRSPLMLAVTLEQIRRARQMTLADVFRMERSMMRQAFHRNGARPSEAIEGIRARLLDKDLPPRWNPPHAGGVTDAQVAAFFDDLWPSGAHPLRDLA